MFTVCPKCALTLVVTAADLRVAQGYVRCGRCSSVFNALARLSEERGAQPAAEEQPRPPWSKRTCPPSPAAPPDAPQPEGAAPPAVAEPEEAEAAEAQEISADELEFDANRTDVNQVFVQPPPDPQWTAATGSFKALIAANQEPELSDSQVDVEIDSDFLAAILRADSLSPAPEPPAARAAPPEAAQPPAPAPAAPARAPTRPATAPAAARTAPARPAARHAASRARPAAHAAKTPPPAPPVRARRAPVNTPPAAATRPPQPVEPRSELADELVEDLAEEAAAPAEESRVPAVLRRHAWQIGAALASLVLVAQILNHYRDDLAVSARFNRPLTALYSAFGVKLFPHWDLRAYDVHQLGAEADPAGGGLITVRASIKNGAPQPQPLPLLRVTFQDRFGNRVAARDVAPKSYLPLNVPATSFLSAGQRIDAEMGFADPGTDAVGFEIDACLPASGGGIACVNDAALR